MSEEYKMTPPAAETPLQLLFLEVMYKKMRQKQGEALQFINLLAKASCDPLKPHTNDAGGPGDLEQQKKGRGCRYLGPHLRKKRRQTAIRLLGGFRM